MRMKVAAGIVIALLAAACEGPDSTGEPDPPAAQRAALDGPAGPGALDVALRVPADGSVIPWTFPAPMFRWDDRLAGNTFRVRVRTGTSGVVLEAYVEKPSWAPTPDEWKRLRTAAGEGGDFEVELVAGSILPDGTILRGPTTVVSRARFSGAGEHPTGHVLFGWKNRPIGRAPGPVHMDMRGVIPQQVSMDGTVETLMMDLPHVEEIREKFFQRMESGDGTVTGGGGLGLDAPGPACKPGFCPPGGPPPSGPVPGVPGGPAGSPQAIGGPGTPGVPGAVGAPAIPGTMAQPPAPLPAPGLLEPADERFKDSASTTPEKVAMYSVDLSSLTRPEGVPAWDLLPRPRERGCVACHTMSSDRKYLAANAPENAATPEGWTATQGTLYLFQRPDYDVIRVMPGGLTARFHPVDPTLLVYAATSNSTGIKQRLTVFRSDIRHVDASTGQESPVPGAAEPDRCELFPDVSNDFGRMAFTRSLPGEPCEGSHGHLEIAVIPWNGGRGGPATPLVGASANGFSNVQPRFSPDGRWIVFYRAAQGFFSSGSGDLWVVPSEGGEARRLEISTSAMETWHAFSPDGRWLAFLTNRDRVDRPRAYVARFFDDGHVAPAVPLPGAGDPDTHVHSLDWGP